MSKTLTQKRAITRQFLVYLAGPITGLSWGDSTDWYKEVDKHFPPHIIPVMPLRGKEYLSKETCIKSAYTADVHPLSTQDGIMMRDKFDVMRADALLVNLLGTTKVSVGTVMEIAWAHFHQKPVILVMEDGNIHDHPMVRGSASIVVDTLEKGIDLAIRIVSPTATWA